MSGADETDPWAELGASPVEMEAATWCERRDQDDWNAHDQRELEAWLAQSNMHVVAYLRMSHVWGRADRLGALRRPMARPLSSGGADRSASIPRRMIAFFAVLAAVGAAIGFYVSRPSMDAFSTPVGGREVLTLADGSQVELNTDTSVRIHVDAGQRTVLLDRGEAYFQVKHDSAHPFTVVAGKHRIVDLGTKFSVREAGNHLRISLLEGSARIESTGGDGTPRSTILVPGDVALATADSLSIARQPVAKLINSLGWRRGVLIFDHTTLEEAAREVNRYGRKKLVIADAAAGRLMIGGTFATSNADAIAEAAKEFFGLRVQTRDDEIVISR